MDRFTKGLKTRDDLKKAASAYTFYVVSFFLIELLHIYLNGGMHLLHSGKRVLTVEFLILFLIFAVLWISYGVIALNCRFFTRENLYRSLLRRYFIDREVLSYVNYGVTFRSILTLALFPEISQFGGVRNAIYGWGTNGEMHAQLSDGVSMSEQVHLAARPVVFSEQITMDLMLTGKGERLSFDEAGEKKAEFIRKCFTAFEVQFSSPLTLHYMIRTADGCLVLAPDGDVCFSLPVTGKIAASGVNFCKELFEKAMESFTKENSLPEQLKKMRRIGILSLFLQAKSGESGFCGLIELAAASEELKDAGISLTPKLSENLLATYVGDERKSAVGRYCLLILTYAQYDQFVFADHLCRNNRRKVLLSLLPSGGDLGSVPGEAEEAAFSKEFYSALPNDKEKKTDPLYILHPHLSRIGNFFGSLPYRIREAIDDHMKGILIAVLFFIFENLIEPILSDPDFVRMAPNDLALAIRSALSNELLAAILTASSVLVLLALVYIVSRILERLSRDITFTRPGFSVQGNRNIFAAEDFDGWELSHVKLHVTGVRHSFPEELRDPEIYQSYKDDGVKYMLCDYREREEEIYCMMDQCRFSDTQAVQRMIRFQKKGELKRFGPRYEEQYRSYEEALKRLPEHQMISVEDRANFPPHSLCAHTCIITRDGYLLIMKRSPHTSYFPGCYSVSTEEQMSILDIYDDGVRLGTWIERMCEEELGLTKRNSNCRSLGEVRLMSVFQEKEILNVALCLSMKLCVTKRGLESVLKYFPRKDYEGTFLFVKVEDLWNHYLKSVIDGRENYHPTSIYRLFWAALAVNRFDIARRILDLETTMSS